MREPIAKDVIIQVSGHRPNLIFILNRMGKSVRIAMEIPTACEKVHDVQDAMIRNPFSTQPVKWEGFQPGDAAYPQSICRHRMEDHGLRRCLMRAIIALLKIHHAKTTMPSMSYKISIMIDLPFRFRAGMGVLNVVDAMGTLVIFKGLGNCASDAIARTIFMQGVWVRNAAPVIRSEPLRQPGFHILRWGSPSRGLIDFWHVIDVTPLVITPD